MPDPQNFPRWLRNSALTIAVLVLLLIAAGASYQSIEARADARRFCPRGKSVDIGGYRLALNCTGEGSPTVVLESGLEIPADGWRLVQPDISRFTRVCSYDRAGYGVSDSGPMPRTLTQIARELHALLEKAGEKPPFVLVGHSFGAGDVRLYSGLYPTEVAGMILAESGADGVIPPASILQLMQANLRDRQRMCPHILLAPRSRSRRAGPTGSCARCR
jgi:pimeloyl-ACP methyl ester carboxylesterase